MKTFSALDPEAITVAIENLSGKYAMELTARDLETVLSALAAFSDTRVEFDLDENAFSLYSGILSTLNVEVI